MVVIENESNLASSLTRSSWHRACRQGSYIGSASVTGCAFTGNFIDSKGSYLLLGFTEHGLAALNEMISTLIGGQGSFQTDLTLFDPTDDRFKFLQGGLEGQLRNLRIDHTLIGIGSGL
jgi:hypothetical protein